MEWVREGPRGCGGRSPEMAVTRWPRSQRLQIMARQHHPPGGGHLMSARTHLWEIVDQISAQLDSMHHNQPGDQRVMNNGNSEHLKAYSDKLRRLKQLHEQSSLREAQLQKVLLALVRERNHHLGMLREVEDYGRKCKWDSGSTILQMTHSIMYQNEESSGIASLRNY